MEKYIYYGEIFNIYKDLLAKNVQDIFSNYYEDNLTLQEIADNLNVSKSYVGNVLKRTEKKLESLEEKLHVYRNKQILTDALEKNDLSEVKQIIKEIINN